MLLPRRGNAEKVLDRDDSQCFCAHAHWAERKRASEREHNYFRLNAPCLWLLWRKSASLRSEAKLSEGIMRIYVLLLWLQRKICNSQNCSDNKLHAKSSQTAKQKCTGKVFANFLLPIPLLTILSETPLEEVVTFWTPRKIKSQVKIPGLYARSAWPEGN